MSRQKLQNYYGNPKGGITTANLTDYGKAVKHRLIELGKSQKWLIEQVRAKTGLYFDDGYAYRIFTGKCATPKIIAAIDEILGIRKGAAE